MDGTCTGVGWGTDRIRGPPWLLEAAVWRGTHGKTEHPNAARRNPADPPSLDLEIQHALVWKHTHSK